MSWNGRIVKYSLAINDPSFDVDLCIAGLKKPAGTAEEIEKHFGCESSQLIMVDKNFIMFIFFWLFALQLDLDLY